MPSTHVITIEISKFSNGVCEILITEHPQLDLSIITIYRPPDTTSSEFEEIIKVAERYLESKTTTNLVITGDFNFPKEVVTWKTNGKEVVPMPTPLRSSQEKTQLKVLLSMANRLHLHQIVDVPTRENNTLDLLFTDTPEYFHSPDKIDMGSLSDHNMIRFNTEFKLDIEGTDEKVPKQKGLGSFDFKRANKDKMKESLKNLNLEEIVTRAHDPIDAKIALLNAFVAAAETAGVPKKDPSKTNSMSEDKRKLHRTRLNILKNLRKQKKDLSAHVERDLRARLREIQIEIMELNIKETEVNEMRVVERIKSNPKAFYAYANKSRKIKSKIGPLKVTTNGIHHYESDPKKMADILSRQYESVFSIPTRRKENNAKPNHALLHDIEITPNEMKNAILDIKTTSAAGPDAVSPLFLKDYIDEITTPLCHLWRKSLDTGIMPEGINLAYITPIFKGGAKGEPPNYRPVALTSQITKAFEKILKKEMVIHLATHRYFSYTQHGFQTGKSTLTNLIEYYESVLLLLQHHRLVDSVYI